MYTPSIRSEALAEEEFIERLKEMIHEFMIRPDRHYVSNTTIRWNSDRCSQVKYRVVLVIHQPEDST